MIDAIDNAQLAMNADKLSLNTISQNIANLHTPAYRKQFMVGQGLEKITHPTQTQVQNQMATHPLLKQAIIDKTNRDLDFAISGRGYFTIETRQGLRYTRRGDFHLNPKGELVTFDGHRVLVNGSTFSVNDGKIRVDATGMIYQNEKPIAKFRLSQFSAPYQLRSVGQGYFQALSDGENVDATTQVEQGFLEQSNVKTVDEMMDMVRIARHFQTAQRLLRMADELNGKAISQLGEG